jgi:hypothetical protein
VPTRQGGGNSRHEETTNPRTRPFSAFTRLSSKCNLNSLRMSIESTTMRRKDRSSELPGDCSPAGMAFGA